MAETYPFLAYSELTRRVYIVASQQEKFDVTEQFKYIEYLRQEELHKDDKL